MKLWHTIAALLICGVSTAVSSAPQRIVSLNLCADELVLRLAPENVKSVTWLARDPTLSNVSALAQSVPVNQGLAEDIVPLAPDLVIVGEFTTRATVALLRRLGTPVLEIGVPNSVEQALAQITAVAAALGRSQRGAQMVDEITAKLAALATTAATGLQRPMAAVYQPNGFTIGQGSLVNDLMRRAGLRNLAVERRIDNYGQLPLELLLFSQPDLLIVNDASDRSPAMAYEILRHPALRRSYDDARVVSVPSAWWSCAGPRLVDAVIKLQQAARRVEALAR